MINIAIVENDNDSLEKFNAYVERFSSEKGEKFNVFRFSDGDEITESYKSVFDVIFIEVDLKRLNGIDTAQFIRRFDRQVLIIFFAKTMQYALKGYAVDAMSFLLKPVGYSVFAQELERALSRIRECKTVSSMLASCDNGIVKLPYSHITYIESVGHRVTVFTDAFFGETCLYSNKTLKSLSERLSESGFFRCNSCYIVNLRFVASVEGNLIRLQNGQQLQISRARRGKFMKAFSQYVENGEVQTASPQ